MRKHKHLRNIGLAVAAIVALGAAVYAAGGNGGRDDFANGGSTAAVAPRNDVAMEDATKVAQDGGAASPPMLRSGEGVAAAGSGPAPQPAGGAQLASALDRKIVSTASLQMQVEDVGGSFGEVARIATSVGGFVANSTFSFVNDAQVATVTIRVPQDSYQDVLARLRGLGVKVDAESSDTQDVTEEYTDLGSRLRTLEATEAQLLTLLGRAETISDILTVQDRLNYTRAEIEQVKGRMQLLDDLTSLATITVHLRPAVPDSGGEPGTGVDLGAEIAEAWDDSLEFLSEVAAGVLTVVVFAWWVPLAGLPLLLGYKLVARRQPAD